MSHWNYRILRDRHASGGDTFALHEVFYDEEGRRCAWAEEPECGHFDSAEELIGALEMMLTDARRRREDVFDFDSKPDGSFDAELPAEP